LGNWKIKHFPGPSHEADAFLARAEGRREAKWLGNRNGKGRGRDGERK